MLIASGTGTFLEFDQSLQRLEAQSMIRLGNEGFASLSEPGRAWIYPLPGLPVQQADARNAPVPAVA
jgi:hypothetical protein